MSALAFVGLAFVGFAVVTAIWLCRAMILMLEILVKIESNTRRS